METSLFPHLLRRIKALALALCLLNILPLAAANAVPARTGNGRAPTGRPAAASPAALAPTATGDTVRINCGGGAVATGGKTFAADGYFTGGGSFANSSIADVLQTTDDELYRTERSGGANLAPFSYSIPVGAGAYKVRLHFAEIYFGATNGGPGGSGKRVFSVALEGAAVLVNYDINAAVGPMTVVVKEYQTNVTDGALTLNFTATVDQPKVSAIEVLRLSGTAPPVLPPCTWQQAAPVAVERKEGQSAVVDGQLYTFGGYYGNVQITNLAQRYNATTNQWTDLAPSLYPNTHMGLAVVDKKIWLIGGFIGDSPGPVTNQVQVYDTQTNTWAMGPPLPLPRGSNAAAAVGHKIHSFGGLLPDRQTDAAEHYVLDADNLAAGWQLATPLPSPRNHLGGVTVGGKIYAVGGQQGHDGVTNVGAFLHVYDPVADTWTRLADLPVIRSHFEASTIAVDGKILIVGGTDGRLNYADILRYDPIANAWDKFCDLPNTLIAPFAKALGTTLVVAQGARNGTALPERTTQVSTIARTPSPVLRFSIPQLAAQLPPGGSTTLKNMLWAYSGTAAYTLTASGAPWLVLPTGPGSADTQGQDVALLINAAGLAAGTYSATVTATAPGYAPATTTVALTVTGVATPPPAPRVVFAVNAGGSAYTDANKVVYQSDRSFTGGTPYSTASAIAGTADGALYQTERYGNFSYAVPVPNGTYRVTFKVVEFYWTKPGQRQFDVLAEGVEVISNLDIFAQVGRNTALDIDRTVTVADGVLNLQFRTDIDNAKLSALLVQTAAASTTSAVATAAAPAAPASPRKLPKTWSLFPNPAAESATLSFAAAAAQSVRVEVLSSQARTVWQGTRQTVTGDNELNISTDKIPAGAYVVRVYLREGVISERLIVIK